ncbi:TPA: tetratricopeptide repeat protein [Candidatus Poribacteria bacterium]|nr:tetratricopeptide repeat protein [Candidatus Poribacteria bacterium]HEX30429.1 tetratricopeptide repeat protein [Candidatus Poribacteria bacterium]
MNGRSGLSSARITLFVIFILVISIVGVYAFVRSSNARISRQFQHYESLFAQREYGLLAEELPKFIKKHPKFDGIPRAYFYLAVSLQERGDYRGALNAWQNALRLNSGRDILHRIYYGMGICHEKMNQIDRAVESFSNCFKVFPDGPFSPKALYNLGLLYGRKGNLSGAVESFKTLLERFPSDPQAKDAADTLGDLNLKYILKVTSTQYEVKRGDSLKLIARRFNSTPEMIMRASRLKSHLLRVGQTLNVPRPEFTLEVDLSDKLLLLKYKGFVVKTYPIGIGAPETPTPTGEFRIRNKIVNPTWYSPDGPIPPGDPNNLLGTRWMGISSQKVSLSKGYGIHGTTKPESIGKAQSDGCIRMLNGDVEELFGLVTIGTPVIIKEKIKRRIWFTPMRERRGGDVSSGQIGQG